METLARLGHLRRRQVRLVRNVGEAPDQGHQGIGLVLSLLLRGLEAPNWSQQRGRSTNHHPVSMGTKQGTSRGARGEGQS